MKVIIFWFKFESKLVPYGPIVNWLFGSDNGLVVEQAIWKQKNHQYDNFVISVVKATSDNIVVNLMTFSFQCILS